MYTQRSKEEQTHAADRDATLIRSQVRHCVSCVVCHVPFIIYVGWISGGSSIPLPSPISQSHTSLSPRLPHLYLSTRSSLIARVYCDDASLYVSATRRTRMRWSEKRYTSRTENPMSRIRLSTTSYLIGMLMRLLSSLITCVSPAMSVSHLPFFRSRVISPPIAHLFSLFHLCNLL